MDARFVQLVFDVACTRPELNPVYRVFIEDEMLIERKWRWNDPAIYLQEMLQLMVPPGKYNIRFETPGNEVGVITNTNGRVIQGPAKLKSNYLLKVS